jgi:hypothetical protein
MLPALGEGNGADVVDDSNPLPLPAWMPTGMQATYGAGECIEYDLSGTATTVACTSVMAVALQWLALLYQVGVAVVVAVAVSIHATQHMTKWM